MCRDDLEQPLMDLVGGANDHRQDRAGETPIQYPRMIRDQDRGRVIRGEIDHLEVLA
jgi:hypothetical protein